MNEPSKDRSVADKVKRQLSELDASDTAYATRFVGTLLAGAQAADASDIHLTPNGAELDIRWRLDGVLQEVGRFPSGTSADVVSRLKVLAELLTYRTEVPQEGRVRETPGNVEMRVSTFPTLHGERAVVRLFAAQGLYLLLKDLGFPDKIESELRRSLVETSGVLIITGPAGGGKTTTAYACLRELVRHSQGGRSIMSLEDPIEVSLPGVAQSQVNRSAGFDLALGLRSILRQDPEVILIGEIRDRATAETAFQASLTGHLIITTFHAGSASEAISRLADMSIEPYLLRSGLLAIISQRLLRKLCKCATKSDDKDEGLGLSVNQFRLATGCESCLDTGYRGRIAVAEMIAPRDTEIGNSILAREDAQKLEQAAIDSGMTTLWQRACEAIEAGLTSPEEARRVLGFSRNN